MRQVDNLFSANSFFSILLKFSLISTKMAELKYTKQFYCSITVAICLSAICGISVGCFNPIHTFIKCFLYVHGNYPGSAGLNYAEFCSNLTNLETNYEQVTAKWSLISSLNLLACTISSFFFGVISDIYGRKVMFRFSLIVDLISFALTVIFYHVGYFAIVAVARLLTGIAAGGYTVAAPIYLQEISMPNDRDKFGTLFGLCYNVGFVFVQVLGLEQVFGTTLGWINIVYIWGAILMLMLFLTFFAVESPGWSESKGDDYNKRLSLIKLHTFVKNADGSLSKNASEDLTMIQSEKKNLGPLQAYAQYFYDMKEMLLTATGKVTVGIMLMIIFCHNFNGYSVMMIYSTGIFSSAGFDNQTSTILTIGMTLTIILACTGFTSLIDKVNKKLVILIGLSLCSIYGILLAVFGQFPDNQNLSEGVFWEP